MKERPILFNGEMVRAVLDGRKTQTRRVVKPQPPDGLEFKGYLMESTDRKRKRGDVVFGTGPVSLMNDSFYARCPYGVPGDRLYVREKVRFCGVCDTPNFVNNVSAFPNHCCACDSSILSRWTPSIHMLKEFSRILLEVVSVRVERVQEISEEGAKTEGVDPVIGAKENGHTVAFNSLWWELYPDTEAATNWDVNPWVWVVEFKRVES